MYSISKKINYLKELEKYMDELEKEIQDLENEYEDLCRLYDRTRREIMESNDKNLENKIVDIKKYKAQKNMEYEVKKTIFEKLKELI